MIFFTFFKKQFLITITLFLIGLPLFSQGTITIDYSTKRFINGTSKFDRDKYFNIHTNLDENDPDLLKFIEDFNITPGYTGSRRFSNPIFARRADGSFPRIRQHNRPLTFRNYIASGKDGNLFYESDIDYTLVPKSEIDENFELTANYIVNAYKNATSDLPLFFEPLNEPMVHAKDHIGDTSGLDNNTRKAKVEQIITYICEFHKILGQKIHATPELSNMKFMGYGSAFPEFERKDFEQWHTRFQQFVDIAGEDVDLFSMHIYDGVTTSTSANPRRRSGSNSEAILDIIEAYSSIKLGKALPIAISEYGRISADQPDASTNGNYEPITNSQAIRSQNHMLMNFIERGNLIATTVPFTIGKADTQFKFSRAALWVPNQNGSWEYTPRMYFYELWKDVQGDRVYFNSTNIDVQTQAFVNNNELFVVLNNLNDIPQNVALDIPVTANFEQLNIKRLKIFNDQLPELTNTTGTTALNQITLDYGETVILKYTFKDPFYFSNEVNSSKYYANSYLQPIEAATPITFNFDNINISSDGEAILRLGLGRDLGQSLLPEITVNGNAVELPNDPIRGYNQEDRRRFFGTLEIPINYSFLNEGINTITVTLPDNGGHISSAILQLHNFKNIRNDGEFFILNRKTAKKIRSIFRDNDRPLELVPAEWDGNNTKWVKSTVDSDGFFQLKNVATKRVFRPIDNGTVNGSIIVQRATDSIEDPYTWWKAIPTTDGYFYLQNKASEMYFRPNSDENFSSLAQRPTSYQGHWTQWKFENVEPTTVAKHIQNSNTLNTTSNAFKVYPNPIVANNYLTISSPLDTTTKAILYNVNGKIIFTQSLVPKQDNSVPLKGINSGIYFLKINTPTGIFNQKLIIK